jgi:tetratricopeptide (TPR) repeat protein
MPLRSPIFLGKSRSITALGTRACAAAFLLALQLVGLPRLAFANELDDFQRALRAYEIQNYRLSTELFEALVGGEPVRLQNRALLLESRKYLAASYLFIGRPDKSTQQFERLLRDDPTYQLDPLAFPEEVQEAFLNARQKIEKERAAAEEQKKRALDEAANRKKAERIDDREKIRRVFVLAQTERVEKLHSRWIAAVPFGVGQFQNGDSGWGTFFAVTEGITAAINVLSYFLHGGLKGQKPSDAEQGEAKLAEGVFRYTNQVSFVLLVGLVAGGIIDAQVRYHPFEVTRRKRELPEELRETLKFTIGAGSIGARIGF